MESQNYLGIYLSKDRATVVCLNFLGRIGKVLGSFSVSVEEQEQATMQDLASLIARGCAQRKWSYSEVALALDCAMFMQHSVHSEFKEPKQILTPDPSLPSRASPGSFTSSKIISPVGDERVPILSSPRVVIPGRLRSTIKADNPLEPAPGS